MPETTSARYKIFIQADAETVWNEITKRGDLQKAMFNNYLDCVELSAGEPFRMLSPSEQVVSVIGTILEVEPPHRYKHTMAFTSIHEPPATVTHVITPVDGGVEYEMLLEDLVPGSKSAKQMSSGMVMIAKTLKALAETGRPGLGVRMLHRLFAVMEPVTPKALRQEHWSLDQLREQQVRSAERNPS